MVSSYKYMIACLVQNLINQKIMSHFKRVVLYSSILIITFDTVGSFASEFFNFAYSSLSAGSYLIFRIAGFFCQQRKKIRKKRFSWFSSRHCRVNTGLGGLFLGKSVRDSQHLRCLQLL